MSRAERMLGDQEHVIRMNRLVEDTIAHGAHVKARLDEGRHLFSSSTNKLNMMTGNQDDYAIN